MTYRLIDPGADRLTISVLDEPGKGGPSHKHSCLFRVSNMDASGNPAWQGGDAHSVTLLMQNGRLEEGKPANGLTEAALLAIVAYRLRARRSPALAQCEAAMEALKEWQEQLAAA
jgi:hypothetical protein